MRIGLGTTALSTALLACTAPAWAQGAEAVRRYDAPAGPLARALAVFIEQGRLQVLYPAALVEGRTSPGLQGEYVAEAGLATLLRDSGLRFRRVRPNVYVLFDPAARTGLMDDQPTVVDDVVVTGSLIRGAGDGPSPVVTIDRDQMDREGRATVAQMLAALPQNFGGTANEAALGSNGGDRSGTNSNYANGVNLRGLGSDATLVLVNGRRLAGTGAKGDFTDVSTIPTAAIKQVDVLLDGASALYGADAVGGVVNIILRDDYEGAETRIRLGNTSDGASGEYQFGQTFGRRWATGNALATYEYNDREALAGSDRRLAGDADLRWRGGTDRRQFYSNPGNIVVFDPASGGYLPAYAIPRGQSGVGLQPGDFLPGQVNLGNSRADVNVLPRQARHSAYALVRQGIGDRLEVTADARYGRRDYETVSFPITTLLTVTNANPYFASPTGARSHAIAYSFQGQVPAPRISGEVESLGASIGGSLELLAGWRLDAYVAHASEESSSSSTGTLQSTYLREALGAIANNPATPFSPSRDGYLNPFGDGAVNSPAVLDFISSGYSRSRGRTGVSSANLQVGGALLEMPAGPLRLAAGLSFREETFERQLTSFTSGLAPSVGTAAKTDRRVAAAFGELRIPVFGAGNRRPGLERLELSLAARFEDYGDVGQTTSPKAGITWDPVEGLRLKANYGRSFRAPALREVNDAPSASPSILPRGSQQVLSMILYGGNPDIRPEEADTWTAGFEVRPGWLPGLRIGVNGFRTDFDDRIGQPALESILTALDDPSLAPFVRTLDPTDSEDLAAIQAILDLPTTGLRDQFPASSYGAIVDARYVNTARVQVRGADLSLDYAFSHGRDDFDLGLDMTWLERFDAQPTPASPPVSQLDRPNFPVGLRGRGSGTWSRGSWSISPSVNFVDAYRDLSGRRIGSWTTADLAVRFWPGQAPLAGVGLTFTVQNLFDRAPPFYDAPEGVAYDAANANVLGRFVSLQLTKAW
jgi:outer membrane receptor protein involved in Fe transport